MSRLNGCKKVWRQPRAERVARSRLNDELERRARSRLISAPRRSRIHLLAECVSVEVRRPRDGGFVFTQAVSHLLVFVVTVDRSNNFSPDCFRSSSFLTHKPVPRSLRPRLCSNSPLHAMFLHKCRQARKGSSTRRLPLCGSGPSCWHRATLILSAYAGLSSNHAGQEDAAPLERALSASPRHCGASLLRPCPPERWRSNRIKNRPCAREVLQSCTPERPYESFSRNALRKFSEEVPCRL